MFKAIDGGIFGRYNRVNEAKMLVWKGTKIMKKIFEIMFAMLISAFTDETADLTPFFSEPCEALGEAYW